METLKELIELAKADDKNAMLKIIEKFRPLIHKYFKKSYYNEDVKSALELKLIEIVKLKLDNLRNQNEGTLVKYIASSLYHQYLKIANNTKSEIICEEDILDLFESNRVLSEKYIEDPILFESLKMILTKREFDCIYYIVFMGYTAEELSKKWDITKQACDQCKKRAFNKIIKNCF